MDNFNFGNLSYKKKNKYGAKKSIVDGIKFDSKKEADHYISLKLLLNNKKIKDLELQVKYPVFINDKKIFNYIADFTYTDIETGNKHVIDVKGFKTDIYKLKKKAVEAYYNINILEV